MNNQYWKWILDWALPQVNIKTHKAFHSVFITVSLSLCLCVRAPHTCTVLSGHNFMVAVLQLHSLSLMPWTDIKESLMMKPSAPISPALASIHYVHSTLFEYQAPIASNTTLQTPFFCFNYWLARFNSQRHGSASTNKLTSGPWDISFYTDHLEYVICFGCSHDS